MTTIKSYTDKEQSKKLAEILPLESADMAWCNNSIKGVNYVDEFSANLYTVKEMQDIFNNALHGWDKYWKLIPCWSLAALLDILPVDWWGYNKHYFLEISKMGDVSTPYIVSYFRFREQSDGADFGRIIHISFQSDNPVDACYEMILKLNELKLL